MFFREFCLLYIYALLHFRGLECALVIKPQNVAAVSGESVVLHCASNVSSGNIVWKIPDPGSSQNDVVIYNQNVTTSSVSSYISVFESEDGNCSLNVSASLRAAKRYICKDADTGEEASAELTVLESGLQCNSTNGSEPYICSVTVSAGNWVPVVECYQWKIGVGLSVLQRNPVDAVDNNVSTRSWNYTSENEWFPIFCQTSFRPKESERSKESSATNIPEYLKQTLVYNGTCVPHSGTTSNSSSAGVTLCHVTAADKCPESPTATTACPATAVTKCPDCPTGATASSDAAVATTSPDTAVGSPDCPTEATASPDTAVGSPDCPTGATASPVTAAAKCSGCLAVSSECHVSVNLKCPDFPAYQEKRPEYPAGADERDVAPGEHPAAGERPSTAGEHYTAAGERPKEAFERPTEAGERPTEAGEHPTEAGERPTEAGEHPEAAAGSSAAAAELPVLTCFIASLVLNCMLVTAVIGYAVYKWKSNKKPEDMKTESIEKGTELTPPVQEKPGEEAGDIQGILAKRKQQFERI